MKMKLLFTILIYCLAFQIDAGMHVGHLNQNHDRGIWFEENFNSKIGKLGYTINITQRLGDNNRRLWFHKQWLMTYYDFSDSIRDMLQFREDSLFKAFSFGPGLANVWAINRNTKGVFHWAHSYRPTLIAFLVHVYRGWQLEQRMVGEYNCFITSHYRKHAFYRHRMLLNPPWRWSSLGIGPFLSNEWFFRSEDSKKENGVETIIQSGPYFENRFRIGFTMQMSPTFAPQLWWQYRTIKQTPGNHPLWRKTYQFGFSANFNF